ncbi:glycosyltransferase family 9 protein [Pinibacter aurantiacus]|uniref:Glycosyltransferase family 9 protein n=1 Tax=Pinibacter aurantiacus TaxID=2851599 RepID=A0A9E2W7E0_9BACT|nr:glycosyltransferase family 9 protein [Pinibacter aurantiacus]MBV4356102.1 glycosyltransferase family 9 protein [Pinibacter aurantiacus]
MILDKGNIRKIAIFRALPLGDLLSAVPAFRALRTAFPDAEIALISKPSAAAFVSRFSKYINRFIEFPGYEVLKEPKTDAHTFLHFVQMMRHEKFDLVLQMHNDGTGINEMILLFGAAHVAGFYPKEHPSNADLFIAYDESITTTDRLLQLLNHLGIDTNNNKLEFPLTEKDYKEFEHLLLPLYSGKFICIHAGARGVWRQWPPRYFALIANYFVEQGYTLLITGSKEDVDINNEVIKYIRYPVIDLTGKTTLGAWGVLVKNALMVVSSCTAMAQMAIACETPSVVVNVDGSCDELVKLNKKKHVFFDWQKHPQVDKVFMQVVLMLNKLKSKKSSSHEQDKLVPIKFQE